jgi:hypothetical protein
VQLIKASNTIGRFLSALLVMVCFILSGSSPASGTNNYLPETGCASPSDACWEYGFHYPGVEGRVNALAKDSAGNIYVGGEIYRAGGIVVDNIAKWDGMTWTSLGGISISSGTASVNALAVDGSGNVYAGGDFDMAGTTPANSIAKWNGSSWEALGNGTTYIGTPGSVQSIEIGSGSTLFVGGIFDQAGSVSANNIGQWNGTSWSALGSGVGGTQSYEPVLAIEYNAANNTLYVAGEFYTAGGITATGIASYSFISSLWSAVGSGIAGGGTVYDLLLVPGSGSDFNLYVGGDFNFNDKDGRAMVGIARWDGTFWNTMATGADDAVLALERSTSTGEIYIGGEFDNVGTGFSIAADRVAKWNGSAWSALDPGISTGWYEEVDALLMTSSNEVIVGGGFEGGSGLHFNNLALWHPVAGEWSGMDGGLGMYSVVNVLETYGSSVFAAGTIPYAGLTLVGGLGELNGPTWTGFGSFENYYVRDLATSNGTTIYIGGAFSNIVAVAADNLAVWNGANWAELGGGTNDYVNAVALDGSGNLYVGGEFTQVGSTPISADHVAMWDGAWHTLGDGLDGDVNDIVVDDSGNVYAAGYFHYAGDLYVGHIAMWDGSEWHTLDYGLRNFVMELQLDDDGRLYAGGYFATSESGIALNGIGMWNGADWSALGNGMDDAVGALAIDINGDLYAGGDFHTAGGIPANHIARWDGFAWSALGNGTNSSVFALASYGSRLIAGGFFQTAGGKPSSNIGVYDIPPVVAAPVPAISNISPNLAGSGRPGFWMTIDGSNFSSRSEVRWNGADLLTTYINGSQLMAYVPASLLISAGDVDVTVFTPAASGGGSSPTSLIFQVLGNHQYLPITFR